MHKLDDLLVEKTKQGDLNAFEQLVERYQTRTYNVALRMLANPDDARDAVQEIFIRVLRALKNFRGDAKFSTWLYRVTVNYCLDVSKARQKDQKRNLPLDEHDYLKNRLVDSKMGPEDLTAEKDTRKVVRRAINRLPEHYKTSLILHYYEELSYREVAEILQVSTNTVATHIARGKKMLQKELLGGEEGALPSGKRKISQIFGRRMPVT